MNTNNKIFLVPIDFTEVTTNAAKQAAEAAKKVHYNLSLLHVIDKNTRHNLKKEEKDKSYLEEQLDNLAMQLSNEYGISVNYHTKEGNIFYTIAEVAENIGATMIFMGTHGKTGMQKLTGSFAHKVITSSEIPVVVVQKRYMEETFKDIVLPITSDAGPWSKTKWAAFVAKEFDARVHIYKVNDSDEIDDTVTMITNHFVANNVSFELKTAQSGNFTKQVIDYATSINSGMIMIMTNLDQGLARFILGSYDEDIIFNQPQIPVMCINPRDFNWKKIVAV